MKTTLNPTLNPGKVGTVHSLKTIFADIHFLDLIIDETEERALSAKISVSFLEIPTPHWCRLPTDIIPPVEMRLEDVLAMPYIPLGNHVRCYNCRRLGRQQTEVSVKPCWIFTSERAWEKKIQVQDCNCRTYHRDTIGPDLRQYGLFNWSNTALFSHELLNDYTNLMQCSTMPLSAFALSRTNHYMERMSPRPFVNRTTFSQVWFAFVELQEITATMQCLFCKGEPSVVICDGVGVCFPKTKLTSQLAPPTQCHATQSIERREVRVAAQGPQLFGPQKLRKDIHRALKLIDVSETAHGDNTSLLLLSALLGRLEPLPDMAASRLALWLKSEFISATPSVR